MREFLISTQSMPSQVTTRIPTVVCLAIAICCPAIAARSEVNLGEYNPVASEEDRSDRQENDSFLVPAQGTITSGFGKRWGRMHKGIDIAAPVGTPIVAAASGVVTVAGWNNGGYGNLVDIQHPDGSTTRYGHNSAILVQVGQPVKRGDAIALMGNTGHSTGSHLHFEIRYNGVATNPAPLLGTEAIASSSNTSPRTNLFPSFKLTKTQQRTQAFLDSVK